MHPALQMSIKCKNILVLKTNLFVKVLLNYIFKCIKKTKWISYLLQRRLLCSKMKDNITKVSYEEQYDPYISSNIPNSNLYLLLK